jgi:hypothetical protein
MFLIMFSLLGAFLLTTPAPLHAWDPSNIPALDFLTPVPLPASIKPYPQLTEADFNNDGLIENLLLTGDGIATIMMQDQVAWQSPPAWNVVEAEITDLNHDGKPEATLLLWRPFQPWPSDKWIAHGGRIADFHDRAGNSCHIILIGWDGHGYRELWAGSALAEPVIMFSAADLNADGKQELVTLEARYATRGASHPDTVKIWAWNGFGFTVMASLKGTFNGMRLVIKDGGSILVLTY